MRMKSKLGKIVGSVVAAVALGVPVAQAEVKEINGAGASFPYPIYAKWAESYNQQTGVKMNYQSIGSGGGIRQITAKTVDFGASDSPMSVEDLDKQGLVQFPMILGGVVPVMNVDGVGPGELKLTGEQLADIYLGKITRWNDPALVAANPHLTLPDRAITVVHRSDGSGTTWIFTNYLTKVSAEWAEKIGNSSAVAWPTGVGGRGNEGVAAYVGRIRGGIGYVEYAYALQNNMGYAQLQNAEGNYVAPGSASFQAAAAGADWRNAPGFHVVLTHQPGEQSWPITGTSFILMHKSQDKPGVAQAALKFFDWSYRNGAQMADELHYVAIPESVYTLVQEEWAKSIKGANGQAIWPAR